MASSIRWLWVLFWNVQFWGWSATPARQLDRSQSKRERGPCKYKCTESSSSSRLKPMWISALEFVDPSGVLCVRWRRLDFNVREQSWRYIARPSLPTHCSGRVSLWTALVCSARVWRWWLLLSAPLLGLQRDQTRPQWARDEAWRGVTRFSGSGFVTKSWRKRISAKY